MAMDDDTWVWNWAEFCGHPGGIKPLNPETHDLGVCFQQLCLQIPVLALIAVISAYHCGKRSTSFTHESYTYRAINIRILITVCLTILPIIRAYIILSNTTIHPFNIDPQVNNSLTANKYAPNLHTEANSSLNTESIFNKIKDSLNHTASFAKLVFFPDNSIRPTTTPIVVPHSQNYKPVLLTVRNKETSPKPIDYLVAGTEGLTWIVHLCFILSLRKGRIVNPRGPVLIRALIFLLIVISSLLLRSHVKNKPQDDALPNLSLGFSIGVVILLTLYALTLVSGHPTSNNTRTSPRHNEIGEHTALLNSPSSSYVQFQEEQDPSYLGPAMENATATSKLLFHWVTPLMEKGVRGLLNHSDDLFDLPEHISTTIISNETDKFLRMSRSVNNGAENAAQEMLEPNVQIVSKKITLLRLLHKCFGWEFYAVGMLKFIADCSSFMGPIFLNKLIGFIEDKSEPIVYGYLYAAVMFFSALIGAFCNAHFNFWMSVVGLKIRAAIITLVYKKILHSSSVQLNQQFNFGEIVNFATTDSDRIINSCPSFHTSWSIPFQLIVTLYLLHQQIGISFLAGVAFAVILIPINKLLANKIGQLSTKLMDYKDRRVRLMGETLHGITTIKLNVWEEHFLRNVLLLRESEIKYLRGRKYLDALCVYFWATTPVLISILTFSTYVLLGHQLTAKTVFTSMALLNMLIGPLNAFPWVLNGLTEAWVSVKRIQKLLRLPDMDVLSYYSESTAGVDIMLNNLTLSVKLHHDKTAISDTNVNNSVSPSCSTETKKTVTFEDDYMFILHDVNITIYKGQLIGVMGKVGSGKSLLLDGILAEITKVNGSVAVNDIKKGFAYVQQNPWLQCGTIRENILFGKAYDHNKYQTVLEACALTADLNNLPKKDLTAVGEAGNTLSGGQKTRITLARAVYADKDIYLLDDVLATLDAQVAHHVFYHVILGLLKNKTRILCTHQIQYLVHSDVVIEMAKGRIINQGKPNDILHDLEDFLLSFDSSDFPLTKQPAKVSEQLCEINETESKTRKDEEFIEKGTVRLGVYTTYATALGRYLAISIFLSMILMQSSKNITDLWLAYWVTHANETIINATERLVPTRLEYYYDSYEITDNYYLTVFGFLALLNSLFTLVRAFMFAYGGIQAAITIHKQLLKTVMRAKASFFDIHSLGRIINRFSSDTYTVDDTLPFIANILFAQLFGLIGAIIVTAYGQPWIFLVLSPIVPVYHWIQNHYRLTSRELKRLSSITLSPLYAHFNESIHGATNIRAFRAVSRFIQENELLLEASQKTQLSSTAASQWLALRLQFIGVTLLAGVCVMAVLQHQYDIANPGLIGLVITYTLSITGLLSGVVNAFTETEREMIAVERMKQYLEHVPVENSSGENPPYAWPSQGVVEFKDVALQYRDHLVPSLKEISFTTRPAEKIGIVGRTGAGKSSLFAALFRLREISSGIIYVDNVNVKNLQLHALRSRLAIIPQNPFLFSGTIRENVDPLNQYPDLHIYKALEKCKLHSLVCCLGGLGAVLEENGRNLSAGQRQLLCLVRAVLQNAKIVCIDEATANVDQETDKFIQMTIKSSFQSATVITIAHRIRTIMHCDRVLVMENGEIMEFDEPHLLIQNPESCFYNLASEEFSDKE